MILTPPTEVSPHKYTKKFCPHKILASSEVKSPIIMGEVETIATPSCNGLIKLSCVYHWRNKISSSFYR